MNSHEFNQGDIIWTVNKANRSFDKARHPIIYLSEKDANRFIGAMITSKFHEYPDNQPMSDDYFETYDDDGDEYEVPYKKSLIVKAKLIKFEEWGQFKIVGRLTQKGLELVLHHIDSLHEETWGQYLDRNGLPRHKLIK